MTSSEPINRTLDSLIFKLAIYINGSCDVLKMSEPRHKSTCWLRSETETMALNRDDHLPTDRESFG